MNKRRRLVRRCLSRPTLLRRQASRMTVLTATQSSGQACHLRGSCSRDAVPISKSAISRVQHFRTCVLSKSSIIHLLLPSSLKLVVKMSSIYNPLLKTQLTKLAGLVQSDLCSFIDRQKVFSLTTVVSLPSDRCKKLSRQKLSHGMFSWLLITIYVPLIDETSWK